MNGTKAVDVDLAMKRKLIAAILSMVCPLSLGAQDENQNKTETLYTSVTGLRIEQNGSDFWVSFGQGGPQRVKLPVELPADPEEIGNLPDEFHASPNGEWIFAAHHIGSCMRGGELFHRGGGDKIDKVEEFNQRWESAVKFGVFARNFSDEGACNMIDFDGWSADSGRILLTLRGGEDKREMKAGRIYFNTR